MSASANINTPERPGSNLRLPLAAAVKIFAGTIVALDAAGRAVPGADTATLTAAGRAEALVDNSAGSAGDLNIEVKRGVFRFANSATQAVDADDIGKPCYVEDDLTVAETSTNKVVAGLVFDVDADGVWVDMRGPAAQPRTQVTLGSTNGTAGAAADLAALKAETELLGDDVRAIHAVLVARGILRA